MFHSVSLFSQAPLACRSRALPSVLLYQGVEGLQGHNCTVKLKGKDSCCLKILMLHVVQIFYTIVTVWIGKINFVFDDIILMKFSREFITFISYNNVETLLVSV